ASAPAAIRDLGKVYVAAQSALRPLARRNPQGGAAVACLRCRRDESGAGVMARTTAKSPISRKQGRVGRPVSRLVQVGFLVAVVLIWSLAATRWGVNRLLLPNPVAVYDNLLDILRSGEFIGDLETTLGELAAAFAISAIGGVALGYLISRSR